MSTNKKENNFLLHGGILAMASILVRFIGMIYRIPMVNIIGREGSGYYSSAYSVYNILLLLSSYSLPLAVSKMVSARVALGKWKETCRVLVTALVFGVLVGLVFAAITYFGAEFFCEKILKSPMAAVALRWMAPTVFIMAVLGVLRGFFQGLQTTIPTAVSQILEQIVNACVSVGMAFVLFQYGVELKELYGNAAYPAAWGAAGGTIGTGAGAFIALTFCIVLFFVFRQTFRKNIRRDHHEKVRSYGNLFKILFFTAVPVILSTAAYNCIDIIDAAVFNHRMAKLGMAEEEYMAVWGDYNNAYLLLVHLPVAFASALASALVPSLSAAYAERNMKQVREKTALTLAVTFLISVPCAFGLMAIGGNLAKLLFNDIAEEASGYLVWGGLAVIFYSVSTVTNAVLQGLNHMEKPMDHAFFSLIVHVAVLLVLMFLFKMKIHAVILSYMCFSLTMMIMNLRSIYHMTGILPDPLRHVLYPVLASVIVVIVCFAVSFVFSRLLSGRLLHLIVVLLSVILGALVYFVAVLLMGCLTKKQLLMVPGGTKLIRFAEILHISR